MEAVVGITEWEIILLELKYCERCGGLWLRRLGTGEVHCAACASERPDFPLCGRRVSRPQVPRNGPRVESRDGRGF